METSWPAAYVRVRESEGGNVDDPDDHGGRTSRGITQREYSAWRRERKLADADVWKASEAEVEEIYKGEYWQPLCPTMPAGIDLMYFSMAVNAGPYRAAVILQRALGVAADGRIGPVTRLAIQRCSVRATLERFGVEADKFYRGLHQPKFLKGWLNRIDADEQAALKLLNK